MFKMQHHGTLNRIPFLGRFIHQATQVRSQVAINSGHPGKMRQRAAILVKLEILIRAVTFVGTHDWGKGSHFNPAVKQLLGSTVAKQ